MSFLHLRAHVLLEVSQPDFMALLRIWTHSDVSATSLQKIDAIDGSIASLMGRSSAVVDGVAKVQLSQAGKGSDLH